MGEIIPVIEKETAGKSFKSHKFCHDTTDFGGISYDNDSGEIAWKSYGETEKHKTAVDLREKLRICQDYPSIFSFFLDGSRHTYKVDDISYRENVYPILAGQVGVGCCERINRELRPTMKFDRKLVIALPNKAFSNDAWHENDLANNLLNEINKKTKIRHGVVFDEVLRYSTDRDDSYEKRGIGKIQDYMVENEKQIVAQLVADRRLDYEHYLIKDGSLEYAQVSKKTNKNALNLSDEHIRKYYQYVVGVSKSFDPTKCFVEGGGSNSDVIAKLKLFQRTPAFRYTSSRAGADFCVWYVRIRDAKYTNNIFDGILKIEKLLVRQEEIENGIDSDEIDIISANLLNERNPVCYGKDNRWANHIYPVYLTETYVKSKYISNDLFLQIF